MASKPKAATAPEGKTDEPSTVAAAAGDDAASSSPSASTFASPPVNANIEELDAALAERERQFRASAAEANAPRVDEVEEWDGLAEAQVNVSSDHIVCRPDPRVHITAAGDIVLMNWFGQVAGPDGKARSCTVKYGTPLRHLPGVIVEALAKTRGITIGPLPPKVTPNPLSP